METVASSRRASAARERYRSDPAYAERRRQQSRAHYAAHRLEVCRRVYKRLADLGKIKRPRKYLDEDPVVPPPVPPVEAGGGEVLG